jgi:hypothetical protein
MDETLGKLIKQSTQQKGEKMEQTKERWPNSEPKEQNPKLVWVDLAHLYRYAGSPHWLAKDFYAYMCSLPFLA